MNEDLRAKYFCLYRSEERVNPEDKTIALITPVIAVETFDENTEILLKM